MNHSVIECIGLFCIFSVFLFCWQLYWIRGSCISFTSCLFQVKEWSKKFEDWNWFHCLIFCMIFVERLFLLLSSIARKNFIVWLLLFWEILGNMYIVIACWLGCDIINFGINLVFLTKPSFLHNQKVKTII